MEPIAQFGSLMRCCLKKPSIPSLLILSMIIGQPQSLKAQTEKPSWFKDVPSSEIIQWRRHIHQNPELSFEEVRTGQYVVDILKSFGNIEVSRPTKTSVLGILQGAKEGKKVAYRADMDALPIQEATGLSFASQVKKTSHACGHDAHTAMLLGTAATLSKMQKEIKGTVYFLFQHAEELPPGGAIEIVQSDALSGVDAIFGMHVIPDFPVGHIGLLPDHEASTASDVMELKIIGKGSHGSMPHLGIDPVVIGAEIVTALQTIVSRNVLPGELTVISVGKFQSGDVANVIPEFAELAATIRTTSAETRLLVEKRIKTIVQNIVEAHGAKYELDYITGYPSVVNSPELNDLVGQSAAKVLGEDHVFHAPMMTASEDFARYRDIAPICFSILGVGKGPANHNPGFNIDEAALENGVRAQVQTILDFLNKGI